MSALPRVRRAVDDVVADLLGPLLRLTQPSPTGWRLLSWDAEQGINFTLERGASLLLVELEPRDEARACYARTARFNVGVRHPFHAGAPIGDAERRVAEQVVALIRAREPRLADFERPAVVRASEVREIEVDRVLMAEGQGHYYLNPYVGCMIGCEFCYVAERADLSRALEGLPRLPWGRSVDVKVNAPEVLRQEVARHPPGLVRLSPILTDPYQPLERRYRLTRRCLEVLLDAGFAPGVLTRGAAVVEDLDLLARFPRAAVGFSVPTDDDRVRRAFEPGADPIEERVAALAACHAAGVRTFAIVQPMLPMDAARLVDLLAPHIEVLRLDRMHGIERVRHLYEAAGALAASTDEFFKTTGEALRRGFAARGIPVDDLDDMAGLVGPARAVGGPPAPGPGPRRPRGRAR